MSDPVPDMQPLIAFLDGGHFANALNQAAFGPHELITTVISHVRHPDPKVSQAGVRQFRELLHDTLKANGHLARQTVTQQKESPDGTTLRQRTSRILPPSIPPSTLQTHYSLPPVPAQEAPRPPLQLPSESPSLPPEGDLRDPGEDGRRGPGPAPDRD